MTSAPARQQEKPQLAKTPARDVPLARTSARELARLIATRAVSPVEVLNAHLAVIEALNPKFNAVVTLVAEQARDAARKAEAAVMKGEALPPLHGLPIAIKDNALTAGIRTTFGSTLLKDFVPTKDAEVVRRLKQAGAIVIGKTNLPEFATGANTTNELFGPTRNPWNPALSAAGSSGGAAVATATGMVPFAHGTDFGCSIRMPAAFCGLVGIRPTPGLVPSQPTQLAWEPGQVHGPLARNAEDAALMLDAMVGLSPLSPISAAPPWGSALAELDKRADIKGLRVAYVSDISGVGVDAEIDAICSRAALALRDRGAHVEQIEFDASVGREAYDIWRGFVVVGERYAHLNELERFGRNLRGNIEAGLKLTARDYGAAAQKRLETYELFRALFERFDVLLTPTGPVKPFPIEQNYPDRINGVALEKYTDWFASNYLVTLVSLPAASAPAGLTSDGLPVGMQIVAQRFEEPLILRVARVIHQASGVGWPPIERT
jgi:amidase